MLMFAPIGIALVALTHMVPVRCVIDRRKPPLWQMPDCGVPTVYLTSGDGPNPSTTPDLLDVLRDQCPTADATRRRIPSLRARGFSLGTMC